MCALSYGSHEGPNKVNLDDRKLDAGMLFRTNMVSVELFSKIRHGCIHAVFLILLCIGNVEIVPHYVGILGIEATYQRPGGGTRLWYIENAQGSKIMYILSCSFIFRPPM